MYKPQGRNIEFLKGITSIYYYLIEFYNSIVVFLDLKIDIIFNIYHINPPLQRILKRPLLLGVKDDMIPPCVHMGQSFTLTHRLKAPPGAIQVPIIMHDVLMSPRSTH